MYFNERADDTYCNRILFKKEFDPRKDIYISFQPYPGFVDLMVTENEKYMLGEDSQYIRIETPISLTTGVVVFLVDSDNVDYGGGERGTGLGLLATIPVLATESGSPLVNETNTGYIGAEVVPGNGYMLSMSGHICSTALDFYGKYGNNIYLDNPQLYGTATFLPISAADIKRKETSVTCRIKKNGLDYFNIGTQPAPDMVSDTFGFKAYRFVFKEHLNRVMVDTKNNQRGVYKRMASFDTGFDPTSMPRAVRVGISHSGQVRYNIKDVTYSGNEL